MSCFQCDLDIPHVCYAEIPSAGWGWTDEAVAALEAAQRQGFMLSSSQLREQQRQAVKRQRSR
jgi:hypothetical protein